MAAMENPQISHILKLFLIALLFFVTPLLSPWMRTPYLYFLLNLLIIALGAEAGLLSFLKPQDDKKPVVFDVAATVTTEASPQKEVDAVVISNDLPEVVIIKKVRKVEKSASAKVAPVVRVHKLKKSPSTPSLFFIGGGETEVEAEETINEVEVEEEEGCLSGQELFTKAETFIGNFYNQLKIQREDSWRKIHDIYHKAF